MARLSFGPSKKKIVFGPCKIFCFLIPPGTIFRNKIFCRDLFKKNNNCRDQKLQNGSRHHVPRMQIITKMGSETILKNKKFFRDQNLNGSYLQGRVQYLSLKKNTIFLFLFAQTKFSN